MDELNARRLRIRQQREAALKRNGKVLAKYLWILLWIEIPRMIATLMTSGLVYPSSVVQINVEQLLMLGTGIAHIICLLRLTEVSNRYKYVAWINIGLGVIKWVPSVVIGPNSGFMFQYIMLWMTFVMNCGAIYLELQGHIDALYRVDVVLSEKWHSLSFWFLVAFGIRIISEFVLVDHAVLDVIVQIVMKLVDAALLVLHIFKLVYLYKTARLFRNAMAQLKV